MGEKLIYVHIATNAMEDDVIRDVLMDAIRDLEDPAVQASIEKYRENFLWGMKNFQGWKEKYGGKIVLILDKEVIFADEDIEKVGAKLASFSDPLLRSQIACITIPKKNEKSFYFG